MSPGRPPPPPPIDTAAKNEKTTTPRISLLRILGTLEDARLRVRKAASDEREMEYEIKRLRHLRAEMDHTIGSILTSATQEKGPNCFGPTRVKDVEERLWKLFDDIRKGIEELPLPPR